MAGTTMLTSYALDYLRKKLKEIIAYAQYKVGDTYYKADFSNVDVLPDGRIEFAFFIVQTGAGDTTVTEVQLCDRNGALFAKKAESINLSAMHEGILYRFRFTVKEG